MAAKTAKDGPLDDTKAITGADTTAMASTGGAVEGAADGGADAGGAEWATNAQVRRAVRLVLVWSR
jgi:hypothetical protein